MIWSPNRACWRTWSDARCDVDRLIPAHGNCLVGVIVWVIGEHLAEFKVQVGAQKHLEATADAEGWKWLTGFLRVSSRVSFQALGEGTGVEIVMQGFWLGDEQSWLVKSDGPVHLHGLVLAVGTQVKCRAVSEQDDDAVFPGIVLRWCHICAEPNIMKGHRWETLSEVDFRPKAHCPGNITLLQYKIQIVLINHVRNFLYHHIPGRRSHPHMMSWGWYVAPALAGCLSCRSRDFHRSKGHTSWASSVSVQTLRGRKEHVGLTD